MRPPLLTLLGWRPPTSARSTNPGISGRSIHTRNFSPGLAANLAKVINGSHTAKPLIPKGGKRKHHHLNKGGAASSIPFFNFTVSIAISVLLCSLYIDRGS